MTVKKIGLVFIFLILGWVGMYSMIQSNTETKVGIILPFQQNKEKWDGVKYRGIWISNKILEKISAQNSDFKDFIFEDMIFKDSEFNEVSFEGSTFRNVTFENVLFTHSYSPYDSEHLASDYDLSSVRFENVEFKNCKFNHIRMDDGLFDQVVFKESRFNEVYATSLGGDISLMNTDGTKFYLTVKGKTNYRQSGGKIGTIVIDDAESDFLKIDKAHIGHLEVTGHVKEYEITNSFIHRMVPNIIDGNLLVQDTHFNDIFIDVYKMKSASFLNCKIDQDVLLNLENLDKLFLFESQLKLLRISCGAQIAQVELIRTPLQSIEVSEARINKLIFKQIALPSRWNIEETGQIDLLEIKEPLFPSSFQYQGKALPQCQVQLGGESQIYTNLPGERLPEILKKQVAEMHSVG